HVTVAVGEAQRGRLVTLSPCLATRDQKRSIKALPGPRSICSGSCGQPCRLFAIILSERGCWRSAAACMLGLENHCTMNKSSFRVCLTFKQTPVSLVAAEVSALNFHTLDL
ncbi:uncharacterized, partial [Tachysurus ichikawai]